MQYAMFLVMRDIRGLASEPLGAKAASTFLHKEEETFASNDRLRVHQQNRYALHRLLARITDYVETQSGQPSRYLDYVSEGKSRYEVEHIWADHPERHADEFSHPADFAEHRNRIGGLLLLPKSFNASYGDLSLRGEAAALQYTEHESSGPVAAPAVLRAQSGLSSLRAGKRPALQGAYTV